MMGLKIDRWRKEVERLWSMEECSRDKALAELLAETRPESASGKEVRSLEELRSAPLLSKEGLRKLSEKVPASAKTFGRHTAGTTGDPTQIWLSKDELGRMLGVRDYCMSHYGLRLGDREARIWGRPQTGWKSRLKDSLMNRKVFHPLGPEALDTVKAILAYQPEYLYGYSSLILEVARLVDEHGLEVPSIKVAICTAETILPSQKAYISKMLCCSVAEEYGSTEFDIIASECRLGHRHIVNPWLLVESSGKGIVVSDVSRKTQSIIRYTQGDAIEVEDVGCEVLGSSITLTEIEGRSINRFAFVSDTEKFHAVEFARALDSYFSKVNVQFRFCVEQVDFGEFRLLTPPDSPVNQAELAEHVRDEIRMTTGYWITLSSGALLPGSKTHYFVNNLRKKNEQ